MGKESVLRHPFAAYLIGMGVGWLFGYPAGERATERRWAEHEQRRFAAETARMHERVKADQRERPKAVRKQESARTPPHPPLL